MKNTNSALSKGKSSKFYNLIKTKMDIKKWISGLTAFTLALAVSLDIQVQETHAFSGSGSGTQASPYIITTCNQLQEINNAPSAYYRLGNDIDCSATSSWNSGAGFDPIGTSGTSPFTGDFDGNGKMISELYINRPSEEGVGLFGYTSSADIYKLALNKVNITGFRYVGALGGFVYNGSFLRDNYVSYSSVSASSDTGGLVGQLNLSTIRNSYSTIGVSGGYATGGLVGQAYNNSTILNSFSSSSINSNGNSGPLVGVSVSSTITNSYYNSVATCTNCNNTLGIGESPQNLFSTSHFVYNGSPAWDFTTPVWYSANGTFPKLDQFATLSNPSPVNNSNYNSSGATTLSIDVNDVNGDTLIVQFNWKTTTGDWGAWVNASNNPFIGGGGTANLNHTFSLGADYNWLARVSDDGGSHWKNSSIYTLTEPDVSPTISTPSPSSGSNYTYPGTTTLSMNVNDSNGDILITQFVWKTSGGTYGAWQNATNNPISGSGTASITNAFSLGNDYFWKARVSDDSGTTWVNSDEYNLSEPSASPTISTPSPADGARDEDGSVILGINVSDPNIDSLTIQFAYKEQGGTYGAWTAATNSPILGSGTANLAVTLDTGKIYIWKARVSDDVGITWVESGEYQVDTNPSPSGGVQDYSGVTATEINLSGSSGETLLDSGAETLTFNSTQTMNLSNGTVTGGESETHNGTTVASALTALKGSSVSAAKKTVLQSGTNGQPITLRTTGTTEASVLIPDDTTVYSEDTWDGIFSPPIDTSATISIPQKNVYSGVKVGSDTVSFVMDKPARVSLNSVTGDPHYKDGTGNWHEISSCTSLGTGATVSSAGTLAFPSECYIEDSGTTYVWTYHFTEFGDAGDPTDTAVSLEVTPGSVTISAPTTIDFGTLSTSTSSTVQSVDLETDDLGAGAGLSYFSIEDLASEDTGYYITLSAGDLTDGGNTIPSTNFTINLEGRSVTTFSTDPSGAPVIPSALLDPGSGDNAINGLTILERTSSVNGVIGEYGIQPLFKLTVPAYTALGNYTGTFTMTLM